jgi:hypothetical protein
MRVNSPRFSISCFCLPTSLYLKQQPSAALEGATSQHATNKQVFAGSCYFKAPAQSPGKRGVRRSEKILPPTVSRNLALQGPWFALKTRDMVMMLRHTPTLPI